MKEVRTTEEIVKVENVTYYEFEAKHGDSHQKVKIRNGEIEAITFWSERGCGTISEDSSGYIEFIEECYQTIRFFADNNIEEFKNIYQHLNEGKMKSYCRKIQQEKIDALKF